MPLLSFYHYSCYNNLHWNSFIFLLNVIRLPDTYCHHMLLTQQQLSVMCQICCEFFIFQRNNVSAQWAYTASVSVSDFRLLKWEIPTFIWWGLSFQHPDLNPVNYKICTEIQQRVYVRKIHNVNRTTLWYGWHGFEQRITNNATDE